MSDCVCYVLDCGNEAVKKKYSECKDKSIPYCGKHFPFRTFVAEKEGKN